MKRVAITIATLVIFGLIAAVSASAEPIKQRLHRQKARIHQGADSGSLTRHEFRRLIDQQRRIRHTHKNAWADGHLSRVERRALHAHLDRASQRIHPLKHNSEWRREHHRSRPKRHSGDRTHGRWAVNGQWDR